MEEENKRRMFIGSKGQPSAVLRSKKNESEEDARSRLTEKGWNMDAPHTFEKIEDGKHAGTGVFKVSDPKPKRKRKRKSKADGEKPEADKAAATEEKKEPEDENKSGDSKESDDDKIVTESNASD